MGWIRISDDFNDHEKFADIGPLGIASWVLGLAHCNRNLTDGYIAQSAARRLMVVEGIGIYTGTMSGRDADITDGVDECTSSGLWHEAGHDCPECPDPGPRRYYVHDYLTYQPSRQEVEEKRAQNAFRQAEFRRRKPNPGGSDAA